MVRRACRHAPQTQPVNGAGGERPSWLDIAPPALYKPPRDALLVAFEQHRVTRGVVELDFMGGFGVQGGGLPFARTAEGPVALVREHGAGRVVVWGDDWILGNPTLDRSPDGKLFWANSLLWLAGAP